MNINTVKTLIYVAYRTVAHEVGSLVAKMRGTK